jgi:hypothetical protein
LASVSAVLLLLCFIGIILMTYRIIKMLDPAEYLFPKIKADCIKTIKRGLKNPRPLTVQEQLVQLEQQMKKVMLTREDIDPKEEKWAVPNEVIDEILKTMTPLKTVAMKLINASDYEAFEKCIGTVKDISVEYFNARCEYKNPDDDFLFSLAETLRDIARTANRNPNVYFSRCIFEGIKDIGLSTVSVNVYGSLSGHNDLTYAFANLLKESAETTVITLDRDRTFDAVANLGRIGEGLALKGIWMNATEIASELANIARLCHIAGDTVTPVPLRRSLAEIFFLLTSIKKLYPVHNLTYEGLIEAYEIMINIPVPTGVAWSKGDPLFILNPDRRKDRSLSALVYASLFSPNHDDNSINHNLDGVKSIIQFIKKYHDKDVHTGWQFTDLLYQIALWLFAFIDKEIQLELTRLPSGMIPTEQNQKKAKSILVDLMKYFLITFFESLNGKKKNILDNAEVLRANFSLLYLTLHLDRKHSLGLTQDIDSILELLDQKLDNLTCPIDYCTYQSFQIFCEFLKRIGKLDKANSICQRAQEVWNERYDTSEFDIVHFIKRPIVTFNYKFINQLDTEIFGPKRSS